MIKKPVSPLDSINIEQWNKIDNVSQTFNVKIGNYLNG